MWTKVNQRISEAMATVRLAFRAVTAASDSSTKVQQLQLQGLSREKLDGAEYFQHYGLTSNPPAGTMAIVLPLNGETSHSVIIATEHGAYRFKELAPGEVALYTDEGASVVLKRGKIVETTCDVYRVKCRSYEVEAKEKAEFTTPELSASEQLSAKGKISGSGGLAIQGGDGDDTATFEGNVRQIGGNYQTDGDVSTPTASLSGHEHPNGNDGNPTGKPYTPDC